MKNMIRKIDLEISISRNFNKVTMSIKDEPVEFFSDEEFDTKVQDLYLILGKKVEHQHSLIR